MTKPKLIGRTDAQGNLVVESLVEWAKRFNETHRLPVAKASK